MLYLRLGVIDSRLEEKQVIADVQKGRIPYSRAAEFGEHLRALDDRGLVAERNAWIGTPEPLVVVFAGGHATEEPTEKGGVRIWAAIEVDAKGRPRTLLKIGSYAGNAREFADNRTDAIDRFRRGTRYT